MEHKIAKLENQMNGVEGEIKVMNTTLKQISSVLEEFKKVNEKVHELELKLAVSASKLGGFERFAWIILTATVGISVASFK